MTNTKNAVTWFEIPVTDMDRAVRFYEGVLAIKLKREVFGGNDHAIFQTRPAVAGALVKADHLQPSTAGTRIYLDTRGELDACVARVASAGGAVILPKTDIGDPGWIAIVRDPEGNAIGLHQTR
jgi:predicted enzyme related to lactoylglutathione lyase